MYFVLTMNTLAAITLLAGAAVAETVHGVVVFTRHGDRTTKHYGNQQLTSLGATQNYQVGSSYRSRYLDPSSEHQIRGISPDKFDRPQIYASAPNQAILSNTATAFLQGLYPPLDDSDVAVEELNDGSNSTAPLNGYQYILLEGVDKDAPGTIWIKGADACPSYTAASESFSESKEYKQRLEDTRDFYAQFYEHLEDVYDLTPEDMSYANAYTIFDLLNVARIHNESSSALEISSEDMFQLRTLADSYEYASNFNISQPERSIGAQTLIGGVLDQLNQTVSSSGKLKFSLLSGSYNTFLAFFGTMGLATVSDDFEGLPAYAATMAFELFSEGDDDDGDDFPSEKDLWVRWMFKNGTQSELTAYPLFGQDHKVLPYEDFVDIMDTVAIRDVGTWCSMCSATEDFCAAYKDEGSHDDEGNDGDEDDEDDGGSGGISPAVAGVIGAVVTLAVVAVAGAIIFVMLRRRSKANAGTASSQIVQQDEKRAGSVGSGSGSA